MTQTTHPAGVFYVQLFGGPRIFSDGEESSISPSHAAILALLFGNDELGMDRGLALSLLWPGIEKETSGPRLSQLLYSLKKRVGSSDLIRSSGGEIRPSPSIVSCDLEEFRKALRSRQFQAVSDLLARGFCPKVDDFHGRTLIDWIESREGEFRREVRKNAEREWQACVQEEDWEGACGPIEALFSLAPENEALLRRLMETKAKAGRRLEAREAFEDFSTNHVGGTWTPQMETEELFAAVSSPPTWARESGVLEVREGPPEPPLLGRNEERTRLRRQMRTPPKEELRGILISGEAGIGKTRLIRESLHGVVVDRQRIFSAEAAELEQLIPLNPLIDAFRSNAVGEVLRELEEPWRTVLFGVMPGHYPGTGPIPEAPHIQPGSVPRRLFEAFYQLLLSIVSDGPVILVLEDIHWADDTTLAVLDFLVRRWDHGDLQLLVSVRTEEMRKNKALGRFLENFRVHKDFQDVPLADLDEEASESLIKHMAQTPMDDVHVSQLRSLSGGNPYFLIELTLEFLADRLGTMATPQDIVPIPVSIRQVLERRLAQLSPAADLVLGSLAVFSRALQVKALARIAQLSSRDCLSGLDQLEDFRLITIGGGEASVSHELVRQTVYQGLKESRKAWLHQRIAEHILRTRKPVPPDDLALHFHRAGVSSEAQRYGKEAADRAEASGAVPEALRFLRITREHSTDPAVVADLIGRMGHLNYKHQKLEEAAPLLELAAQRFRRQGNQARALRAEVERIDCLAQRGVLPEAECLDEIRRLKEEARESEEWGTFTKALDVEVHRWDHKGNHEAVEQVLREAQECANLGGEEARCRARAILALKVYYGFPREGLAAAREAVSIALTTDDTDLQLHALNRLIVVLLYQGMLHTEEGVRAFDLAGGRLARSGDLILKFFIRLNRAVWHLEVGEFDQAKTAFLDVAPVIKGTDAREAHAIFHLNEGELHLALFDLPAAKESFTKALSFLRPSSPQAFRTIIHAGLGLCALKAGDLTEARLREGELPPLGDYWTFDPSVVVSFKAGMLRRRGDHNEADRLLRDVSRDVRGRLVTAWIKLSTDRAKALMRTDPDEARRILDEVLHLTKRLGLEERSRIVERLLEAPKGR